MTDFWKRSINSLQMDLRDVAGGCRIDVCEENELSKKHLPVRIGQLSKTVPVQRAGACLEQVCDVGPVKSFPTRDEELGGDHFFRRKNFAADAENLVFLRAIYPRLFDGEGRVTNSGNEVDKIIAVTRLGKPDWILHVGFESLLHQNFECAGHSVRRYHEIEVLGGAPDPGVVVKCEASADGEGDAGPQQSADDALVACVGIGSPYRLF